MPGCSVHCTPGPSERCIKYTEFSASKLSYTSRYFMVMMVMVMVMLMVIKCTKFSASKLSFTSR